MLFVPGTPIAVAIDCIAWLGGFPSSAPAASKLRAGGCTASLSIVQGAMEELQDEQAEGGERAEKRASRGIECTFIDAL